MPRHESVAWVASSYGYNYDLLYFEQIFREFCRRFPNTSILVSTDWPVERYPDLPLVPLLGFRVIQADRRLSTGATYRRRIRIPSLRTLWRLARLDARVFIVIEFTPLAVLTLLLATVTRRRTVLLVESDPSYRGTASRPIVLRIKAWLSRRADAILVSNRTGFTYLRDEVKAPADRILVGPYLTSQPEGAPPHRPQRDPSGPVSLLFLNSVTERKGVRQLLTALSSLDADVSPTWRLDVVGDGDGLSQMKELASNLGLRDRVTFHGQVPFASIAEHYARADVVVCPTLADYRSLGGFEAVNMAKPVILSTRDGAHHEIIEACDTSWAVDPLDGDAFTATLAEVLRNTALVERSRAGAVSVPPEFSVRAAGENLERAVRKALGPPDR